MQPFLRPAVRLVWGHARFGLDRSTRPGRPCWGLSIAQSSTTCMRCNFQAIGPQSRLYSTERPPRDSEKSSRTNKDVEDELESILKPRSNPLKELRSPADMPKLEDAKPTNSTSESAAPKEAKPEHPEIESEITKSSDDTSQSQVRSGLQNLRHLTLNRMSELKEKFSHAMDTLQSRAMNASQTLNDITGYTGIEAIKHQNAKLEADLAAAHERVREARQEYKTSNASRATTQREVTTLLARKDNWSPIDLERFTELYRADHTLEGKVAASQEALTEAEMEEQRLSQQLNAGILKRYHEEQIWSDRIRRASTWGTWGLMGMNFVLFVILQFVAEPWKRRRLVRGVVAEEKAVLEEVRGELEQVKLAIENQKTLSTVERNQEAEAVAGALALEDALPGETLMTEDIKASEEAVAAFETVAGTPQPEDFPTGTWQQVLLDPEWWKDKIRDICSERRIDLRMRDASLLVLEGALVGAVFTGSVALLMIRRS
ncbi:mitochondrion biogenesis (She9) [Fusarium beomiforme]|uniref:Sensitive to high expression protein 9, mitochondrial n=1 Tax=Fusarium beomiforme TaxID=44412 RepID=A0A9P5DYG5_9HYPO|nr:mitochondrion biogenesis (She9) [Fusarium beomiforme]